MLLCSVTRVVAVIYKAVFFSSAVTCNSGPPSSSASSLSPMMSQVSQSAQPLFIKCTTCALHRDIILMLTAFLHTVLINCPSACVWFNLRSDGPSEVLCGSALDLLPCSTTQLPISAGDDEPMVKPTVLCGSIIWIDYAV